MNQETDLRAIGFAFLQRGTMRVQRFVHGFDETPPFEDLCTDAQRAKEPELAQLLGALQHDLSTLDAIERGLARPSRFFDDPPEAAR